LIASGLVTPVGKALLAAVMTVAILTVHLRHGIWNTAGGFEFPLLVLTTAYVVSALGQAPYQSITGRELTTGCEFPGLPRTLCGQAQRSPSASVLGCLA